MSSDEDEHKTANEAPNAPQAKLNRIVNTKTLMFSPNLQKDSSGRRELLPLSMRQEEQLLNTKSPSKSHCSQ
jgi:hypothetical protein